MKKQHQLILSTAKAMGIEVIDISDLTGEDTARLIKDGKEELLVEGTPASLIPTRSKYYCDNKELTKRVYKTLHIPSPESIHFSKMPNREVKAFFQEGVTYVCKPVDGANGIGVCLNIKSLKEVESYWQKYQGLTNRFILEEQVRGLDLRVQVIGGKIAAACTRVPAFITGDGKQSVEALTLIQQARTRANNEANDLTIDDELHAFLQEQGYSIKDIPEQGKIVHLKKLANMAQGAIAMDLTDELHPVFQSWIDRLVDFLQVTYFAIDIMAIDHKKEPNGDAWVIEINACPEWLHHTFSEGKRHDVARMVLEDVFA